MSVQKANEAYLTGLSDGLEIVAEKIKRHATGETTIPELTAMLNGIIIAIHQGKEYVADGMQELQLETLLKQFEEEK